MTEKQVKHILKKAGLKWSDFGKYMRGQLPEAVETALKDLRSEAITQGWEGANDRSLQYANDAVREAISKAIATATAEAEKRERERIQKWLLDNQTLETPELGKIVLWGWIWAVVNNNPDEDGIQ